MPKMGRHMGMQYRSWVTRSEDGSLIRNSVSSYEINSSRVPSKASGRKGTRRAWKRAHPPGWFHRMMMGQR